ncbi:Serine acetyltransferase [hydrothermal vent metagenome]|uniref:Serine acetyltransferase n=1 Tax=hydrothermal vent metagenome TaxID=652676 RepID=A0A1W1CBJ8_9ZZZZ
MVIHARTEIGDNCLVGQGVTIGGKANLHKAPKIGNFVYMAAGSRIIGDITIGNNVVIGVNAVVNKSVPDNCVVAGIPAKIIKRDIDIMDYMDV